MNFKIKFKIFLINFQKNLMMDLKNYSIKKEVYKFKNLTENFKII